MPHPFDEKPEKLEEPVVHVSYRRFQRDTGPPIHDAARSMHHWCRSISYSPARVPGVGFGEASRAVLHSPVSQTAAGRQASGELRQRRSAERRSFRTALDASAATQLISSERVPLGSAGSGTGKPGLKWNNAVAAMLSVAARCREPLAGKPCGIIGGKENGDAGDVVRLSDATERRARDHRLLEIATNDAAAVRAFGLDLARRNSVHPDFSR